MTNPKIIEIRSDPYKIFKNYNSGLTHRQARDCIS